MSEDHFMRRALELAELGKGNVSPNPMVGCVIVHNEKIIGEGYHKKYGEAHAEVNAINSVSDHSLLQNSSVFVTLEPCTHFGKTPPCADLLIAKKVKRVVIACRDPFEQVDGKGIEKLKQAGIDVELGLLEKVSKKLNKRFFTFHREKRPYTILKWAQTADGFMARSNFDSKWISNGYSRQLVHKWRSEEDAILIGKNTAIHDDPSLNVRDWIGENPVRVLLDSNLEVANSHNLLDGSIKTLVFNKVKNEQKENIQWFKVDSLNPSYLLEKLYEQKLQSIIIEGGSKTLNSFIQDNCWDEARVFISKVTFGEGIPAPKLEDSIAEETFIHNDRLTIYENKWLKT